MSPRVAPATPSVRGLDDNGDRFSDVSVADVRWRGLVRIEGRIRSMRVRPWAGEVRTLECTVVDDTGGIELVFLGRSAINGLRLGTHLTAEGRVGAHHGRLAILNPRYELRSDG